MTWRIRRISRGRNRQDNVELFRPVVVCMFGIEGGEKIPSNAVVEHAYSTGESSTRYTAKSGLTCHSFVRWEGQYQLWLTMSSSTYYIGKSRQSKGRYEESQYSLANANGIWCVKTNVSAICSQLRLVHVITGSGSVIYV